MIWPPNSFSLILSGGGGNVSENIIKENRLEVELKLLFFDGRDDRGAQLAPVKSAH